MITYIHGDIFYSPARVLVNPVNTVGVMGSGLAYDFKRFFPEMYEAYQSICHDDRLNTGDLFLYKTPYKWILNFPTKRHYRAGSKLEYIEDGLKKFAQIYAEQDLVSVSFPALGVDRGGLDWEAVRPLMEAYLAPLPITIYIHRYNKQTRFVDKNRSVRTIRRWLNAQTQITAFETFWKALTKTVREKARLTSYENHGFRVVAAEARGKQRPNLKITPAHRRDAIFVPETQLRDLWDYIRRAGYVLPQNLPAGLEEHEEYLIPLLVQLPFLRPIELAPMNTAPVIGLHYIPPINKNDRAHTIRLK